MDAHTALGVRAEGQPVVGPVRWFTVGVIVLGCSSLIYILGGFFQLVAEGELNRLLGTRKMKKTIEANFTVSKP